MAAQLARKIVKMRGLSVGIIIRDTSVEPREEDAEREGAQRWSKESKAARELAAWAGPQLRAWECAWNSSFRIWTFP